MSAKIKCPKCRTEFIVASESGTVKCPKCRASLKLASRKSERRSQQMEKTDNKVAMQVMIGVVILFALVAVFTSLAGSDDETETPVKKEREDPVYIPTIERTASPSEKSRIPERLARQLLIAMAKEEPEAIEPLILWDKMFAILARQNNWEESRRYENQDDAGKERMRQTYLLRLLDPDYCQIVRDRLLEYLEADAAPPYREEVEDDYGNIGYLINDARDKPLLEFLIKIELLDGRDPVVDAQNPDAWRIVSVKVEQYADMPGKKKTRGRKALGADLGKKPKVKKRRPRGPVGPPEAEPKEIPWLAGTSPEQRQLIKRLINEMFREDDIRKADQARNQLIELHKPAIPGLLTELAKLDNAENDADIRKGWLIVQVLREITGQRFGYGPTNAGSGRFGMTHASPEERVRAVRRWFGWWEKNAATFVRQAPSAEEESWDDDN